jgi:hypothetical protein
MNVYQQCYRRAAVLERWADIYGGKRAIADWARFEAARLRLWAEIVKAWRLEEIAGWTDRQLRRSPRFYAWLRR